MSQNAIVNSLRDKIERLIDENNRLEKEYRSLSTDREALREDNRALKITIADLEKRIKLLELGSGLTAGAADTKQARARINHLMREIDKCIELMNK